MAATNAYVPVIASFAIVFVLQTGLTLLAATDAGGMLASGGLKEAAGPSDRSSPSIDPNAAAAPAANSDVGTVTAVGRATPSGSRLKSASGSGSVARASTELRESAKLVHDASRASDTDLGTAWCEADPRDGAGQWIELRFLCGRSPIAAVGVFPGYGRTKAIFGKNNRISKASLSLASGPGGFDTSNPQWSWSGTVGFADEMATQYVPVPLIKCSPGGEALVRLEIVETYAGSKFRDTCVSEITLFEADEAVTLPVESTMLPALDCATGALHGLDKAALRLRRNEIYARHGRAFESDDLRKYFESKSWYRADAEYRDDSLSADEIACVERIKALE